jgi:F-type H+-transporting ATPase subunit a
VLHAALRVQTALLAWRHGMEVHLGCLFAMRPTDVLLIGRYLSVAFGVATILPCAVVARRLVAPARARTAGLVAMLLLAAVLLIFARRKPGQLKPEGRIQHLLEAVTLFVRDDIVRPNFHHHPDAWVPHFAAIFLAILACNLIGLIPGTGTATGNIAVTTAFAITTLFCMLYFGMKEQGVAKFWINLVPVPFSTKPAELMIWLMLAGIELLGLLIKPVALAIRLFANMFAGHTVLLAFCSLGLIIHAARPDLGGLAVGMSGFGLLLAFAIFFLELLVACIQAYVFTLLSAVFIGSSMHPEH